MRASASGMVAVIHIVGPAARRMLSSTYPHYKERS
jgi:hypothetical protein